MCKSHCEAGRARAALVHRIQYSVLDIKALQRRAPGIPEEVMDDPSVYKLRTTG